MGQDLTGPQLLTHSRMASFKSCRKRAYWEYEVGLRKDVDAKALRMGSAGHDGLDVLKQGDCIEDATDAVGQHYVNRASVIEEYDWEIERETIESLVAGYNWRWQDQQLEVIESEKAFRLPLINPKTGAPSTVWMLAGKIDGIVRLEDGRLAVLEHKFISDPLDQDGDYWRRLELDTQITLYVYAARQLGFGVETVLYDVVRKPTIRPTPVPVIDEHGFKIVLDTNGSRVLTKQGKPRQTGSTADCFVLQTQPMSPDDWSVKLLNDVGLRPSWYFARQEIARLDSDINEFLEELWDIQKTFRDAQLRNRWYKTVGRDSCPWCSFFGLCSSKFDPSTSEVPEGFIKLDDLHPELKGSL